MIRDNSICLECGLCCNGVLFARGELRPSDDVPNLRARGLRIIQSGGKSAAGPVRFRQPCAAFDGCRCRIYADRPRYCREFECLVLKRLASGTLTQEGARRIVARAHRRVDRVCRLLERLNEPEDSAPLSVRFRRVQKRLEFACPDPQAAAIFGELTLAMSDLNQCLREEFLG